MADTGKVLVFYRETKVVCLDDGVVIEKETPEGITVRHTYRKGTRVEFIPREKLEGIVYEDIKPDRKPSKAKSAKPEQEATPEEGTVKPKPVEAKPAVTEEDASEDILSESEDFDDDGDNFDDEFEDDE